ncbi:response regulator [Fibrella forsythiae]|uniref:Response regulator transcription factor n=1 Tax=Fibrella forsythiae TaxID=2817061 RepID=A0ABS3JKB0_9BACT|nr:response regulator transcription factor [Fibrella forsythiae]MBO0950436.1 response regulator transcription factor [Fibrella forsythiae]
MPQRILIADDHQLFVDGLRMLIDRIDTCEVIGEARNGREALAFLHHHPVDCVLIDVEMPELNGIETTRLIKRNWPNVNVLAISMMIDFATVQLMLQAGADGYLLKSTNKTELSKALESVAQGRIYVSAALSPILLHGVADRPIPGFAYVEPLTRREREIVGYIAEGLTNDLIAKKLCIARTTVDTHRKNILSKTGCKNTAALIKFAIEKKLLASS